MRAIEIILLILVPAYLLLGYAGYVLTRRRRRNEELRAQLEEQRLLDELISGADSIPSQRQRRKVRRRRV